MITNHAQARTAEQYLDILITQLSESNLSFDHLAALHDESESVLLSLIKFYHDRKIRLVVDNTKEE